MTVTANLVFALALALLLTHEMDAVRHQEWKMLAGLKNLPETVAYRVFTALHIPLYASVLALLLTGHERLVFYLVDGFLVLHLLLHLGLSKHPANRLNNSFSQTIVYGATALAVAHLVLILAM